MQQPPETNIKIDVLHDIDVLHWLKVFKGFLNPAVPNWLSPNKSNILFCRVNFAKCGEGICGKLKVSL